MSMEQFATVMSFQVRSVRNFNSLAGRCYWRRGAPFRSGRMEKRHLGLA